MSRIGRLPVAIPAGVEVSIAEGNVVTVKGPKGTLERALPTEMEIKVEDGHVVVARPNDLKKMKSLHGLTRSLIHNMVVGVSEGYSKTLEVNGVGYKAAKQGKKLVLSLGYSHPVEMEDPDGIEKKVEDAEIKTADGVKKASAPIILKETKSPNDDFWSKESEEINTLLNKKYGVLGLADVIAKKITEMELESGAEQPEVSFTRNPKVKDYLNSYNKEDLVESAKELEIPYEGLSKEELAEQIAAKVLDPEVMKSIFLQADEWEIDAFDHASTRKCFLATHKDWKELEWFSNKGYIVAYSDNHAEVPQEVIAVYNQINTPELQEKCRQLSWMRSCQSMMGLIYAIAPLKIVYRMYRKRDGFRVNYEKFMEILNELSEKDDICIIKGDKMIWKAVLQDNLYEKIEEFQGDRDFYIPTVEETLDYAKHGYPSQDVSYRKLASFLRDELHISEEKIEELLYIVYKEFSMDGMLSDIMEEFKKRDIVFDSDRQMERFAPIMMEVNNNTRMLDFRGYTPNEVSRAEQAAAPAPVAPAMPSFVPMANTPTVNMQPKKKVYPNDPCPCGSGKKYKKCCGRN